jgi:NADH:ubiquinone oxidoreductase subunit E
MACYVMGSQSLVQELEDRYGVGDGGTTADGELTVQVVNGCLGACDIAPLCKLDADFHGQLTGESLNNVIRNAIAAGGSWRDAHAHVSVNGSSHD